MIGGFATPIYTFLPRPRAAFRSGLPGSPCHTLPFLQEIFARELFLNRFGLSSLEYGQFLLNKEPSVDAEN
jgi:hypothetical protein